MFTEKKIFKLNRINYVTWKFELWRFRISIYKMGEKCDLRMSVKLGKEW